MCHASTALRVERFIIVRGICAVDGVCQIAAGDRGSAVGACCSAPLVGETHLVRYTFRVDDAEDEAKTQEPETHGPYARHSAEFKREEAERVLRGEVTDADLSCEMGVARTPIQRWMHWRRETGETSITSDEGFVLARKLGEAQNFIRELERTLARKQVAFEISEATPDDITRPKRSSVQRVPDIARQGVLCTVATT